MSGDHIPLSLNNNTYKSVYECLKPNGLFVASNPAPLPCSNSLQLLSLLPDKLYQQIEDQFHFEDKEIMGNILKGTGFEIEEIAEIPFLDPLPTLNDLLMLQAASLHLMDFKTVLGLLQEICENEDVSFLYNKDGQPAFMGTVAVFKAKKI